MTISTKAAPFYFQKQFPLGKDKTRYRLVTRAGVRLKRAFDRRVLVVEPAALTRLAAEAMRDVSFLYRPTHLAQLAAILRDHEASDNDRSVASALLRNAVVSAGFNLPMCQDTGTAIVTAWKGEQVWTGAADAERLSRGVWEAYARNNLRYSQVVASSMCDERNSRNNLPAQIDIAAVEGMSYEFLFVAKGGGSANKTHLFQANPSLLSPSALLKFLKEKTESLGTTACPPYHLAFVIGGTSAEACLHALKLASSGYLDLLPKSGNAHGRAFRDVGMEKELFRFCAGTGVGAQFGGKYLAHDVRVIRLPRHAGSLPIAMGVSCSADRNIRARIDAQGVWVEALERRPQRYLPKQALSATSREESVRVDLNRPMKEILAQLARYPVGTRLALSGRLVVARDAAHARFKRRIKRAADVPRYLTEHPIYYGGPAKTPRGKACGSLGPTTSGRMDESVEDLQSRGASLIMLGKGNRSPGVADSCRKYGGVYLGTIGGAAALLTEKAVKSAAVLDYAALGMEAVRTVDVEDFPAYIVIDGLGNDLFSGGQRTEIAKRTAVCPPLGLKP